jgi:hypothetical protein
VTERSSLFQPLSCQAIASAKVAGTAFARAIAAISAPSTRSSVGCGVRLPRRTDVVEPVALVVEPLALVVEPLKLVVEPLKLVVEPLKLVVEPLDLVVEPDAVLAELTAVSGGISMIWPAINSLVSGIALAAARAPMVRPSVAAIDVSVSPGATTC